MDPLPVHDRAGKENSYRAGKENHDRANRAMGVHGSSRQLINVKDKVYALTEPRRKELELVDKKRKAPTKGKAHKKEERHCLTLGIDAA